jgi:FtsP/CotA-like multicopper oxidase with cupredoxin domain
MAGLGTNIGTEFDLWSMMNGSAEIGGETVGVWFFGSSFESKGFMGDRYLPSLHIEPVEGELITINYRNMSGMPHTIHLHGLDVDQANDGVPQTSLAIPPAGEFAYQFVAPHAGTYHYHCHVDTVIHYHRGMSGTVIVRPPGGETNLAWVGGPTFDEEVLWHLHTFDMSWKNITTSGPETARHRPDVFLLNGKETPAAAADPFTRLEMAVGQTGYVRVVNSAYQWARVRLGGLAFKVVASDGRPMRRAQKATELELGPGERYDLLVRATSPAELQATIEYLDDYTGDVIGQAATGISIV